MADNDGIDVASGASDLEQTFSESVGKPGVAPDPDITVSATAQAEIETIQEAEQALGQHDDRWRQLSDRLSARPQATPSMDIGCESQRSIAREYTEHRHQWDAQRDAIEIGAIREVIDIRANGMTLTKAYTATAELEQPQPVKAPEPPESVQHETAKHDASDRFQREFTVAAPDRARTNEP